MTLCRQSAPSIIYNCLHLYKRALLGSTKRKQICPAMCTSAAVPFFPAGQTTCLHGSVTSQQWLATASILSLAGYSRLTRRRMCAADLPACPQCPPAPMHHQQGPTSADGQQQSLCSSWAKHSPLQGVDSIDCTLAPAIQNVEMPAVAERQALQQHACFAASCSVLPQKSHVFKWPNITWPALCTPVKLHSL